ncbi:hypothetical protein [Sinomonas terrae]|uniref:DUF222 domain-containing protein n=1 Tax=Sinomonas terrae TaxID=2908838 RepID=A0ABS9U5Y2_9MICC|nr:hypothetical protein [Sinomonas terrae]MCH6472096.1 hypothetical protein [Sinomonas terrae]
MLPTFEGQLALLGPEAVTDRWTAAHMYSDSEKHEHRSTMDSSTTKAATTTTTAGEAGIAAAIGGLLSEYEALEERMTLPAHGRRAFAMERLAAACFAAVEEYLDPYGLDSLNERAAEEALGWSLAAADQMTTIMLDFRETVESGGLGSDDGCRDGLRSALLEMWRIAMTLR